MALLPGYSIFHGLRLWQRFLHSSAQQQMLRFGRFFLPTSATAPSGRCERVSGYGRMRGHLGSRVGTRSTSCPTSIPWLSDAKTREPCKANASMRVPAKGTRSSAPLKVLFIGNSFTARNDVPGLVAQLAAARGKRLQHRLISA